MSFKDLLNQTCLYADNNSTDEYGNLSFANAKKVKCRFSKSGKSQSYFAQGVISQKSGQLWIDDSVTPKDDDRVQLNGVNYRVKMVDEFREGDGEILGYKLIIDEYV